MSKENHNTNILQDEADNVLSSSPKEITPIMEAISSPRLPPNAVEFNIDEFQLTENHSVIEMKALFDFNGEEAYKELNFKKDEIINVVQLFVAEGWHLAQKDGQLGLVPIEYLEEEKGEHAKEHNSTRGDIAPMEANSEAQRNSVISTLKPIRKFSWFINNGVEEFILGLESDECSLEGAGEVKFDEKNNGLQDDIEKHYIEDGPYWQQKTDLFSIYVHSPQTKLTQDTQKEYTSFLVTSTFGEEDEVTVERRFSQFEWLHERLQAKFRALILPPLPEKQFAGRFSDEFIERRRRLLQRYLNRLARHSIIRYSELFTHFLNCTDENVSSLKEWISLESKFAIEKNKQGMAFFQNVFHPEFNVDEDGEEDLVTRFSNHMNSIQKLIPMCHDSLQGFRDHTNEAGHQYRKLSLGLIRLISGLGDGSPDCINEEKVWCFKDHCVDCLKLTKAIQEMAEHLQNVANTYELYSDKLFVESIELIKEYINSGSVCAPLIEMHKTALGRVKEISSEEIQDNSPLKEADIELVKSRCDTVFNVTLAEMNRLHDEKVQDFHTMNIDFIELQIEFHEKILSDLKKARATLLDPIYSEYANSPRELSSIKVEEIAKPATRPSSVSSLVGDVVDNVGSFLRSKARHSIRNSMLGDWMGFSGKDKKTAEEAKE